MGEDPSRIREEIEQTRNDMGDTLEAIGHKADVPSRARDKVSETKDALVSKVSGATPDTDQVADGARRAAGLAQENPLGLAIGAAAFGFLLGMVAPGTSMEDRKLGPVADDVKSQAQEKGREALERGKQVAQDAAEAAGDAARESAGEPGQEMQAGATA